MMANLSTNLLKPSNSYVQGRKSRGDGGDVSPSNFWLGKWNFKYPPKFFTKCIRLFRYARISTFVF